MAWAHEVANGATVQDVSTPERARAANLTDYPGFDLLSRYPNRERRLIEVKGRADRGTVDLRESYWLYVVFNCASPHPQLLRIQDPFGRLIGKKKISIVIQEYELLKVAEETL